MEHKLKQQNLWYNVCKQLLLPGKYCTLVRLQNIAVK